MLSLYLRYRMFADGLKSVANDEKGQTVVEYCVMIGLVALAIIAATPNITTQVVNFFTRVGTSLTTVGTGS